MRYIIFIILFSNIIQAQKADNSLLKEYSFAYREPYFVKNFDIEFRIKNKTHTLEENWGLWGHNIHKFISVEKTMFSIINGKINSQQYCFSNTQLKITLENAIKNKIKKLPQATKFMIMPNDNHFVCQCNKCESLGNTKTNASPAVFTLLNTLAKKFPKLHFFSTAYITTQTPAPFKLRPNAGVMISTMAFPKGVVIEESNKLKKVTNTIKNWKKRTCNIYLWDYAINFDNYFEFYPTVFATQKNLQFYKKQGITGVFIQGNENSYAAFSNLKCYLYAQLLQNTDINIKNYIKQYFNEKYPSISTILYKYYSKIEQTALKSKRPLPIYGGMQQSYKKYLNKEEFELFYKQLQQKIKKIPIQEQKEIAPLMLALTFQWLEIKRTTVKIDKNTTKKECAVALEILTKLQKQTKINTYNEIGKTIKAYNIFWEQEILNQKEKNLFYNKKFQMLSQLDEDYPNSKMLNDGLVGFSGYYNNWLLATKESIKLEIAVSEVKGAKSIELCFLDDEKHKIYLPNYVIVSIDKKSIKVKIHQNKNKKNRIKIDIELQATSKLIKIEVFKQVKFANNSIACDEIIFN